jgi:predicted enzyme related to lactoylglutathione lyase
MADSFFWYDLMTTDMAAAKKFYSAVLGWGIQESVNPVMEYTVFTVQGVGVAGLLPVPDEVLKAGGGPAWMGYIHAKDLDDTLKRLTEAGGTIRRPPVLVPGIIRFAVVADPQGAGFLVAQPLSSETPPTFAPDTPGTVGWRELMAVEWQSAFAFYEKLFGWEKGDAIDMKEMGVYQLFLANGARTGGMMTKPDYIPVPHWGFYHNVEAIDAAAARVTDAGGQILMGPHQVPGGQWIVQCKDPQGGHFSLVSFTK